MLHDKRTIIAIAFVTVAIGFLAGFWPLSVLGILIAAVAGHWVVALLLGLLLDVAYGAPTGQLFHFLYFPLTLLAAVVVLVRAGIASRLRKSRTDRL